MRYAFTVPSKPAPQAAATRFFVERDSLEHKQLQEFLVAESPSCEVVMACDPDQAIVLALKRRGKAQVLLLQGGLADGRAMEFLAKLDAANTAPFSWVVFADRRHCRGTLDEPALDALRPRMKPGLAGGWVLVRFLDQRPLGARHASSVKLPR